MNKNTVLRALKRGPRFIIKKSVRKGLNLPSEVRKRHFIERCKSKTCSLSIEHIKSPSDIEIGNPSFSLDPKMYDRAIELADLFLSGKMILFGSLVDFQGNTKEKYPWNRDFINDVTYPLSLYPTIKRPGNDEIKVPWEFGRLHVMQHLAIAYAATNEERYIEVMKNLVLDFREKNPLGYGVQWTCAMEVGIRIFSILNSFAIVSDIKEFDDAFRNVLALTAIEHGEFIFANLETDARLFENNHYVANLLGLVAISTILPSLDSSEKWSSYALRESERVIRKQILDDGTGFEGSTRYSRLIWEMFATIGSLFQANGTHMSDAYWKRFEFLSDFLYSITPLSGISPQIGDNDSGRILYLSNESFSDLRYVKSLSDLDETSGQLSDAYFYNQISKVSNSIKKDSANIHFFPNGGVSVFNNDVLFFYLSATDPHRYEVAGHAHCDKLAFYLEYKGSPFIVDPGTGNYTCDPTLRDKLRSVESHSTIGILGNEQNEFEDVFWSAHNGTASIENKSCADEVIFQAKHDCYLKRFGVMHERSVRYLANKNRIFIDDELTGSAKNENSYELRFILYPEVEIESLIENKATLINGSARIEITLPSAIKISEGLFSSEYMNAQKTIIIYCELQYGRSTTIIDLI